MSNAIFHIAHLVVVHGGQELEHGEDDAAVDQDGLHHAALVERQTARGGLLLVTRGPGGRGLGAVLGKIFLDSQNIFLECCLSIAGHGCL